MKQRIGKLVRNGIPERIRGENHIPNVRTMDDHEFRKELAIAVIEEAEDLIRAGDDTEASLDAVANLHEILPTITNHLGIADEAVAERIALRKETLGGYDERVFLDSIE